MTTPSIAAEKIEQEPGEAVQALRALDEVLAGVELDEQADARDQQDHQQAEPVDPEVEREAELWHPADVLGRHPPVEHPTQLGDGPQQHSAGREGGER